MFGRDDWNVTARCKQPDLKWIVINDEVKVYIRKVEDGVAFSRGTIPNWDVSMVAIFINCLKEKVSSAFRFVSKVTIGRIAVVAVQHFVLQQIPYRSADVLIEHQRP